MLLRNADELEMVGERDCQVSEVFWGDTIKLILVFGVLIVVL